jgi:hypothetical protein
MIEYDQDQNSPAEVIVAANSLVSSHDVQILGATKKSAWERLAREHRLIVYPARDSWGDQELWIHVCSIALA